MSDVKYALHKCFFLEYGYHLKILAVVIIAVLICKILVSKQAKKRPRGVSSKKSYAKHPMSWARQLSKFL